MDMNDLRWLVNLVVLQAYMAYVIVHCICVQQNKFE